MPRISPGSRVERHIGKAPRQTEPLDLENRLGGRRRRKHDAALIALRKRLVAADHQLNQVMLGQSLFGSVATLRSS